MDVEIVEMPAFRAAGARGPLAHAQELWGRLGQAIGQAGLFGRTDVIMASVMSVDILSHGPEGLDYLAAAFLPEGVSAPAGLDERDVPAGRYARATYIGPYDGLGAAWGEFTGEWLPSSGHEVSGDVCYQIYRSNPDDTPAEELRTELYIPIG
jgi:AraC family transcriptional regulator